MGIIKKIFGSKKKSNAELTAEVLRKATEHMNSNDVEDKAQTIGQSTTSPKKNPTYENIDITKKKNIRTILLEIANIGDVGMLAISVSDKTGINQQDASTALASLEKEKYVEAVSSAAGKKYYLTATGRKYCISKEFNSSL